MVLMVNYTAKYTKISSGYMGQLVEWPEVVTEGKDLEECRAMLRDALHEMVAAYKQLGNEIPLPQVPPELFRPRPQHHFARRNLNRKT
jgi:predicted RNase H-like HicB family nuclease